MEIRTNGVSEYVTLVRFLRMIAPRLRSRMFKYHRLLFNYWDSVPTGADEQESFKNADNFRDFIKTLINERRIEILDSNFQS